MWFVFCGCPHTKIPPLTDYQLWTPCLGCICIRLLIILGFHRIVEHFLDTDDITVMFSDKYPTLQTYLTNSSLEPSDKRPEGSADSLTCHSQVLHIKCLYCGMGCSVQPTIQAYRDQGPITIIWSVSKMFISRFISIYELVYKLLGACRIVPFLCACQ
jgi:hypothetical protein